jgi:hypothetical protein
MSVGEVGRKLQRVDGPRLDIYVRIWVVERMMDRVEAVAGKAKIGWVGAEWREKKRLRTDVQGEISSGELPRLHFRA